MVDKIPVRAKFSGSTVIGLSEFQTGIGSPLVPNETVGIAFGGTSADNAADALINLIGTPTCGRILVADGTNWVVLPVGANGTVLTADSGVTECVSWAAGGGGGSVLTFSTIVGDTGSIIADVPNDTLLITGGTSITTSVSGSPAVLVITNDDPGTVNDVVQARRSTAFTLSNAFMDVTHNNTDVETDDAVIEHNNTNTDDIDIKVTGVYRIGYEATIEPITTSNRTITADGRVRVNDTTVLPGSETRDGVFNDSSIAGEQAFGSLSQTFYASLTASDKVTLQLGKTQISSAGQFDAQNIVFTVERIQ